MNRNLEWWQDRETESRAWAWAKKTAKKTGTVAGMAAIWAIVAATMLVGAVVFD